MLVVRSGRVLPSEAGWERHGDMSLETKRIKTHNIITWDCFPTTNSSVFTSVLLCLTNTWEPAAGAEERTGNSWRLSGVFSPAFI